MRLWGRPGQFQRRAGVPVDARRLAKNPYGQIEIAVIIEIAQVNGLNVLADVGQRPSQVEFAGPGVERARGQRRVTALDTTDSRCHFARS